MSILPSHWYYNTESGELTHGNNLENLGNNLFGGLGWHELNISGNATEAQAAAEAKKEFPSGKAPTTSLVTGAANQTQTEVGSLLSGTIGVTGFSGTNFVLRAVKIIIGGVLLISGIIHMAGIDKTALGIAGKAVIPA
jgi:hypothetical protein